MPRMPEHHPFRFIAYFIVLPILCGAFLSIIYNYIAIPYLTSKNYDYYNILFIMALVLVVFLGLCLLLLFLSIWRRLRDKLRGIREFCFFMFLSVVCFFTFAGLLIGPTSLILGRRFPSKSKYPLKQLRPVVINNANVVDVENRVVLRNMTVLFDHGIIREIGGILDVQTPPNAIVIDAGGKTLLPGLIDAHVHLGLAGKAELYYRSFFVESLEQRMERNARLTVESGVTTVREMPDYFDSSFELRRAIDQGYLMGPKMLVSGPTLAQYGGYLGWPTFSHIVGTKGEVRSAVNTNLAKGSDFLIIPTPDSTLLKEGEIDITEDQFEEAINHAHELGLEVTAHTMWYNGAMMAVDKGIDGLEHMPSIMEPVKGKLVDKVLRESIYIIPTVFAYNNFNEIMHNPDTLADNPEFKRRFGPSYEIALSSARQYNDLTISEDEEVRNSTEVLDTAVTKYFKKSFLKFADAGVTVGVGTDAGDLLMPHGWISKELEKYVEYGMSPMEAIVAATYNNAFVLNKVKEIGRVKPGLKADLVLIEGDPTANINDIEKVDTVFKDGVIVYKKGNAD